MSATSDKVTLVGTGVGMTLPISVRLTRVDDPDELAVDLDGGVLCVWYGANVSARRIQDAMNEACGCTGIHNGWRVTQEPMPAAEEKRRRPGPPPRAETARERSARWRRDGR